MDLQPDQQQELPWSTGKRACVSGLILVYLAIVFSGPATNSISSDLTDAINSTTGPVRHLMYLDHGYRYFAPDPGPSHLLRYEIGLPDQSTVTGQIPNPEKHWPRLLYHRWFMLSERLFEEVASLPDQEEFNASQKLSEERIALLSQKGKRGHAMQLERSRTKMETGYRDSRKRIDELANSIAQHLIREHQGSWIKLTVHERAIPFPGDIILGEKLDNPERISPALKSWVIEASDGE